MPEMKAKHRKKTSLEFLGRPLLVRQLTSTSACQDMALRSTRMSAIGMFHPSAVHYALAPLRPLSRQS